MSELDHNYTKELTPYEKRIRTIAEQEARIEYPAFGRYGESQQADIIERFLPLAIRQIQREAEAYSQGMREGWLYDELPSGKDIQETCAVVGYIPENGYAE